MENILWKNPMESYEVCDVHDADSPDQDLFQNLGVNWSFVVFQHSAIKRRGTTTRSNVNLDFLGWCRCYILQHIIIHGMIGHIFCINLFMEIV